MTKVGEETLPPQLLFNSDGTECGNTIQLAAEGGEERAKEDRGESWGRPATAGWGDDERMPRLVPRSVPMV